MNDLHKFSKLKILNDSIKRPRWHLVRRCLHGLSDGQKLTHVAGIDNLKKVGKFSIEITALYDLKLVCEWPAWSLYYKTYYKSCHIVISQGFCHCNSLPPQSNICGQGQEPTIRVESHKVFHSGKLQTCLLIIDKTGSGGNTIAYYNTAKITAVIRFIVHASGRGNSSLKNMINQKYAIALAKKTHIQFPHYYILYIFIVSPKREKDLGMIA